MAFTKQAKDLLMQGSSLVSTHDDIYSAADAAEAHAAKNKLPKGTPYAIIPGTFKYTSVGTPAPAPAPAPVPVPPPPPPPASVPPAPPPVTWNKVADENKSVTVPQNSKMRFGSGNAWVEKTLSGPITCDIATFGSDPLVGTVKVCQIYGAWTPAPPAPTPTPPAPVPLLPSGKYRSTQNLLFSSAPLGAVKGGGEYWETPARASVADPKIGFGYGGTGANVVAVDIASSWAWKNKGGDWIDAAGVAQGSAPHWSVVANAVAGEHAEYSYTADATKGVKASFDQKRWNAYVVRGSAGARQFDTSHGPVPPVMKVVYEDNTTAVLKCTSATPFEPSSVYGQTGNPFFNIANDRNGAIEFERPTKAVKSATVTFMVRQHWSGDGTFNGFLADPQVAGAAMTNGLAQAYPLDLGIEKNTAVIFAHRYQDGSKDGDWFGPGLNVNDMTLWSPDVFDPSKPKDTSKLPHIHQGKWTKSRGSAVLVPSTYAGDGFVPLAPGLGALRVVIPGHDSTPDGGAIGNYGGGWGCDMAMYLPDPLCGLLDEIYIRYHVRLGNYTPVALRDMKMYRNELAGAANYAVYGGKFGPGASQWTQYGGNSGVAGGTIGWTNRFAWQEAPADVQNGAMRPAIHSWDMLGYDGPMGTNGIGGAMYPGYWYCVEERLKLNTVDTSKTPWTADPAKNLNDAEIDVWVDGRKASQMRDFSYRKLPLDYTGPATFDNATKMGKTPIASGLLVPIRQLGVTAITLNDYNGGVLPAQQDRVKFYAGLVVSTKPIGLMAGRA